MKRLTWILLATLPTITVAETGQPLAAPATTNTEVQATTPAAEAPTAVAPTATSSATTPATTESATTTDTSVNAAGVPVSGSETTAISADPAATATAAMTEKPAPVGPRPGGPNKGMLPEEFKVYYSEKVGLSKTAFKGGTEKVIPTKNDFTEVPGCYITCYTKDAKKGLYSVGDNHYLIGQIRVSGHYYGGNCLPKGFENKDVRTAKEFKEMCEKDFPEQCEKESCTAGNNHTAQWFN